MYRSAFSAKELFGILLLTAAAGGIGIRSIVHTVLLTRDGVFWVECARRLGATESVSGTVGMSGQNYLFRPEGRGGSGTAGNSGMGLSVGTNGITVVEHSDGYVPALAVYDKAIGDGWNHIAVTYTAKQPRIYLNGTLVHTGLFSPKKNVFAPRQLGGRNWGYFQGYVRSVGIWNRALSDAEVLSLSEEKAVKEGLAGYWPLDEGQGNTAQDRSGHTFHATLNGAAWAACGEGYALHFDGVDDTVSWDYPAPANFFTVSAWVQTAKTHALPSVRTALLTLRDPGFPLMIYGWHRLLERFGLGDSALSWALAGQSLILACRLLSIVPLYFIGRLLVGGRHAFCAILILLVLPWPAEWGHDVLREWPHLLFLAGGALAILWAFAYGRAFLFLPAGCAAGLGYLIRPECAQLVLYALAGLTLAFVRPREWMPRKKALSGAAMVIIGFGAIYLPYAGMSGQMLPTKLRLSLDADTPVVGTVGKPTLHATPYTHCQAGLMPSPMKGLFELFRHLSENLYYYFFPFMLIGAHHFFVRPQKHLFDKRFVAFFILFNCLIYTALYHDWGYINRRHVLPLTAMTVFFIPMGLNVAAEWFYGHGGTPERPLGASKRCSVFWVLLLIGVLICLPKLFQSAATAKIGFRKAAQFLNDNTPVDAVVASPDRRIGFYANRGSIFYKDSAPPPFSDVWDYLVTVENTSEDDAPRDALSAGLTRLYAHPLDASSRRRGQVVVYRRRIDTE
jgi:hypothetical protein